MLFAVLLLAVVSARAEGFRFALMSDLHVTADSLAANDLRHAVDQINATPGLSFVIVSGDFTDYGDDASLRKAKAILDGLKLKYYVTSGNHETKWSESGATAFGRIFGSDRFRFEYGNYLFLGFNTGPVIRMAEGHVAPQDVSWLEKELADYGTERPVFLVTHYPMMKGDVDNWYAVTDAVRKYDIRAFIGGHYHTNRLADYDGIPAFICRSTLRGGEPFGGYSEFEVTADSVIVYERKIGAGPQRWGAYSLKDTYFTADTAGYVRPDFSINARYGRGERDVDDPDRQCDLFVAGALRRAGVRGRRPRTVELPRCRGWQVAVAVRREKSDHRNAGRSRRNGRVRVCRRQYLRNRREKGEIALEGRNFGSGARRRDDRRRSSLRRLQRPDVPGDRRAYGPGGDGRLPGRTDTSKRVRWFTTAK